MAVTICFFLEQRSIDGPNLRDWHSIRDDFGVSLIAINWKVTNKRNTDTDAITKHVSLVAALEANPDHAHIFLEKATGPNVTDLVDFTPPAGDILYVFGRNSHGFRGDLQGSGVPWLNLPGRGLYAHEAARGLLESVL